ncbi:twin-arginine translocase subunit TatC [Leptospirillum ferrooxidans]|uniref:Sec-independent protein translocase protein TatC n=1 Tax=Leptospirillum ferrooxidans (strain C2-3) TaxID=1162668 RepID=I0IQS8_LEPFC|nr:twin-arginine translocase subunit TatC [Leptospirillum ferrooxidans]BAM07627.1 putative secin-dependent protein translocase [Leptospirillum ferrooxidans C2-3]
MDRLPFLSHLSELRSRVLRGVLWISGSMIVCFPFSNRVLAWLGSKSGTKLVFTTPTEAFWITLKVALTMGLLISYPLVLWEIWRFVAPGLYREEKKRVFKWLFGLTVFFFLGVVFSDLLALPQALHFLVGFGQSEGLSPFLSVDRTISFELRFLFVFGLIFELPLLMALLTSIGWVTPESFRKGRRWALVGNAVVASVLSPTQDFFNMMIMYLPMVFLYELGILLSAITMRQKKRGDLQRQMAESG